MFSFLGQGYDGAHVMSGRLGGVQKLITDQSPRAIYIHCSNHSLDLVLKNSCSESDVKSFFGTIKTLIRFINKSPKRKMIFKAAVEATVANPSHQHHHTLIKMCETRYESRRLIYFFNSI
jgi:hypothetical protein